MMSRRLVVRMSTFTGGFALAAGALGAGGDVLLTVDGSAGDELGSVMSRVGDVDGDGLDDLAVGLPAQDLVLVFSGSDGSTLHKLTGTGSSKFGACVAAAGDVDGDGLADIAVGATADSSNGAVHVFSGKDGSTIASCYGDYSGDEFGSAIACVGDQDGDGLDDVVGCAKNGLNPNQKKSLPGSAKCFLGNSGKAIWTAYGARSGDVWGASACRVPDIDGDGYDDVVIGAPKGANASSTVTGYVSFMSANGGKEIQKVYGDAASDEFGTSVVAAGDLDGDGVEDVLVGAVAAADSNGNATGLVRAVDGSGGTTIWSVYGASSGDKLGAALDSGEDADGDKLLDVVVGAPGMLDKSNNDTGAVLILSGKDGSEIGKYHGAAAGDKRGASVAFIPDADGDSIPDLVVGSPGVDTGGTDAGSLEVVAGGAPVTGPNGSVSVAGGAAATATQSVTLNLSWTDGDAAVTEMRFKNSADVSWGGWVAAAATHPWTLPAGDGAKTVQAQFRDGNSLESPALADSILLDTTAPTGSCSIASGAQWAQSSNVTVTLSSADGSGSGVTQYRIRNLTGTFGAWTSIASQTAWTLGSGEGQRTVEVQYRDAVLNESAIFSDQIGVDSVVPTCSVLIAQGTAVVTDRSVQIQLGAADPGGSGVAEIRLRNGTTGVWGNWRSFAASLAWTLDPADGEQTVQMQSRDVAGNESAVMSDTVVLDGSPPVIQSAVLSSPRLYHPPAAVLVFDVAIDDGAGTGVDSIRTSWDGGSTWTPWASFTPGNPFTPERPALSGAASARFQVRDAAGNTSDPSTPVALYFLDPSAPSIGSGGKGTGAMDGFGDIDEVAVNLVAGDALTVKIKGKSAEKKQAFALAVDLVGPDAVTLINGTPPAPLGITGFVAPVTGRYLIVVRRADGAGSPTGSYSMKVTVKPAASAHAGSGSTGTGEFTFPAAEGSVITATLNGAGIEAGSITLEGPAGPLSVATKVKGSKVTVSASALGGGTGTYTLRFTAPGDVSFAWKTTQPKPVKIAE
ncbi:MAG: hypothetical protein HMLKMBBP_01027 [Planctomycetes bacterium]|nr:hypothetical protein [Planctomycetota bacterium]